MNRFYFILGVVLFLLVGYWFVAHSFVIVRLTAVFAVMFCIAALLLGIHYFRSFFK
jgi:preprotein translocase subunit SecG